MQSHVNIFLAFYYIFYKNKNMTSTFIKDKRTFFIQNDGSGGGWNDDPFERDEELAIAFKRALSLTIARRMSTPNPFGLADTVENIVERAKSSGPALILMAQSLRPIANTILDIPSPSDRLNSIVLANAFKGFDLSV